MNEELLSIETVQVEIKVVRVGGHKMTISVFEQIHTEKFQDFLAFEEYSDFIKQVGDWQSRFLEATSLSNSDVNLLGHVNRNGLYLLYTETGMLKKTKIEWFSTYGKDDGSGEKLESFHHFIAEHVPQLYIAT